MSAATATAPLRTGIITLMTAAPDAPPPARCTSKLVILATPVIPEVDEPQYRAVAAVAGAAGCAVVVARDQATQRAEIVDADIAFGYLPPEILAHAERLRWLQAVCSGVDQQLYPAFVASPVVLTSEKGLVGPQLAEHAFALLLTLTRGIATAIREPRWENRSRIRAAAWELTGRTLGIVGLGGTGRAVARRAAAFGMHVVAVTPRPAAPPPGVDAVWGMERLHDLLGVSDVVMLTCPLTPASRGLFDAAAFRAMQRHAILINVGRGEVTEEEALVTALRDGWIAGAGLDVTPVEPLPPAHPLWSMENVILSFHTAGATPYRGARLVERFGRNLAHFLAGEPLEGVIDKVRGC